MKKNQVRFLFLAILAFFIMAPIFVFGASNIYLKINNGEYSTKFRKVTLYLSGPEDVKQMKISNNADFSGADWEDYKTTKTWYLDYGSGYQTVYVKFKNKYGDVSNMYRDTIQLNVLSSMSVDFYIVPKVLSDDEDADDNNYTNTKDRSVTLYIDYSVGVEQMKVGNRSDFSDASWMLPNSEVYWTLSPGSGEKTVYVEFKDANGELKTITDTIYYDEPEFVLEEGSIVKGQTSAVYYLGYDGKLHPFINSMVFHSWYSDFSDLEYVSNAKLKGYEISSPVCVRQGTWLLKFRGLPRIYSVLPACQIQAIRSEAEASILYGPNWSQNIVEIDTALRGYYKEIRPWTNEEDSDEFVDYDRDGVEESTEEEYGTSDRNKDSDGDNLSDYEEIFFWFSDPMDPDSDGDGYYDGLEIVAGFSPLGPVKIDSVFEGSYMYPIGSLIQGKGSNKYYYRHSNGKFYYVSGRSSDSRFKNNNFQERFANKETYDIRFVNSGSIPSKLAENQGPQILLKNGSIINL